MTPPTISHTAGSRQDRIPDIRASIDLVAFVEHYTGHHYGEIDRGIQLG